MIFVPSRCPKCGTIQIVQLSKPLKEAFFNCRFCKCRRKYKRSGVFGLNIKTYGIFDTPSGARTELILRSKGSSGGDFVARR